MMDSSKNQAERNGSAQTKTVRGRVDGQRKGQSTNKQNNKRNNQRPRRQPADYSGRERNIYGRYQDQNDKQHDVIAQKISDCSLHYALALSNPWSVPEPPCIPDNVTLESYKFAVRSRGTFTVGTGGVGFVAFNPFNPYTYSASVSNSGFATGATYAPDYYSVGVAGVAPVLTDASQPATNADAFEQAYRVVGSGIKVMYTGNEMNRQGELVVHRDPSNSPIPGASGLNNLSLFRETSVCPVLKDWRCVIYKPATASDLMYAPRGNDLDNTTPGSIKLYAQLPSMLCMAAGCTPGSSFAYDYIVWFEMTGRSLPILTTSHADPIGLAAASAAVSTHQPETTPQQNAVAFGKNMDTAISNFSFIDTVASVAQQIIPIVQMAANAFL